MNYMPSRPDLSFVGLDNSIYKTKLSETETSISRTSKDIAEKPKTIRPSALIIEDWDTDNDNDSVFRPKTVTYKTMFTKINFVKSNEKGNPVNKENTHKQVEYPKKSQSPRVNNVTTAGPKAVVSAAVGYGENVVKFVAFAGSPKGGKITGKGKIRTGKLDFEDVYLVKELKFNLFSVSQMCDKKNSVLFTETECLVLSPDLKNQINHKVKIIRCDNGTEFKNNDMNQFCGMKGIKREFSVARTPQQNGVVERKNRTLIRATRNMLADSLLCTIFCAKAVSTACYVQNRVLVTKPHNKTPYELLHGKSPSISFMRPFGCLVTILNTLDTLGKFDGKADEGFFVGYSINSKAFRVFNTRTRKVEENLHITFLENKPNVAGSGPDWLFYIDLLTNSMNYEPVTAGNQTNKNGSIKDNVHAVPTQQYILLSLLYDSPHSSKDVVTDDVGKKTNEEPSNEGYANNTNRDSTVSLSVSTTGQSFTNADDLPTDPLIPDLEDTADLLNTGFFSGAYDDEDVGAEADLNNLETTMNVSPIPITRIHKDHPKDQIIGDKNLATQTRRITKISEELAMVSYIKKQRRKNYKDYQNCLFACFLSQIEPKMVALIDPSWIEAMQEELLQFRLQKAWRFVDLPKGKHAIGTKWVYRNKKDERGILFRNKARLVVYRNKKDKREIVVRNKARLVAQGYTQEEGINYDEVFAPVARVEAIRLFLAYASFMGFIVYQMDVKSAFLYGTIEEEVYVCQPPGFEDPQFPNKVYKVEKALYGLHQAHRACQEKYVADILKKFDFVTIKTASTLIETNKALLKDEEAEDVDVHLYRSMIGSLMYLTASRPDIMFAVCACARFQVTPKVSHLHAVKRIFRYLKGQPKLGLWYPRDSPFDLEAFSDSDYAGASLDRKSTIGGCQFLGKRLISWQCKKQTVVANSTTEAEYVAAANCCGQVLWIQNQMLDYGFNFMNTKIYIDNEKVGEGSGQPTDPQHTSTSAQLSNEEPITVLSSSQLKKTHKPRKAKRTTKISQSSGPIHLVADETVYKEWEDRMERAATTASSLDNIDDGNAFWNAFADKTGTFKKLYARHFLILLGII
ncbi:putative ribonuclease H-like domain-containing protein [Tanacetum coccineum]